MRRLRLLIAALVVSSVSVVGVFGTAYAADPQTGTGTLEICKLASGKGVAGNFAFRIEGRPGTIDVPVGGCSLPVTVPVGQANVTEVARPGFSVAAISAIPTTRLAQSDPTAGTAKVDIVAGGVENQTILTFTNKARPKGWLEVCKVKPAGDSLTGRFNFTVSQAGSPTRTVTVPVGGCSMAMQLPTGPATVTEVARTGAQLVGVAATPANRLIGPADLPNRTANVQIVEGDLSSQTIVTFTNKNVPPPPKNGLVKICKKAGPGVTPGSTFTFTLATRADRSVDVKAGSCSAPQEVPVGNLTVTEKATNGLRVSDITVDPAGARVGNADLTAGTVTVAVEASRVVTEVTFTNRKNEPGTLKVCKVAGTGVVPGTPYHFTVGSTPVRVRAGSCSLPMSAPAGNLAITEASAEGTRVTDITVAGAGSLVSRNLNDRTATVNVASGAITEAVFTNTRPSNPVRGCVWTVKYYKRHGRVIAKLVPSGGLTVGSDKLSARQAQWALKAGLRRNFRFRLQSELIAALLNQLGGASTPAKVQAAIDAAQLLLSHGDGALHKGKWNTLETGSGTTVRWKGRTSKAVQLRDVLRDYNQGKLHGCPDTCSKKKSDNDKPGNGKPGHGKPGNGKRNWRAV
ncbi:MAG TPA: hypothetical protein VJ966_06640 [Actinomycetes bacterium]|nr:hypothetical protein [Actinomycetes bacterium]